MKIDAHSITAQQIRDLRREARAAGDNVMSEWCDVALAPFHACDSTGRLLHDPTTGDIVTREEARQVCADAINNAY
jgi:hypothetical protein